MEPSKVEASFKEGRVHSFLTGLIELCSKHHVSIIENQGEYMVEFHNWDCFFGLEANPEDASLYWPRIQTDIIVRRKNEQRKSKENS